MRFLPLRTLTHLPLHLVFPAFAAFAALVGTAAHAQIVIPTTNRIVASDGVPGDNFGVSVALSGNTALVGAFGDAIGANNQQGSAYLFNVTTGTQTAKLVASDGSANDNFGQAVALLNNTALVGAYLDDIGANTNQGSAYLFNATTGAQLVKLTANDGAANDKFGNAVALSGNTALIGAYNDAIGANSFQGSAYLFNAATGTQLVKLTANDGATDDNFGVSVALSGNTALVGAYQDTIGANRNQGSAYLFNATTGAQTVKLVASDGSANDYFGTSVSLSGNFALVGAFGDTVGANRNQGSAYLFNATTGAQLFKFTALDGTAGDYFGFSVALSGNTALIGAHLDDVGGNPSQGSVYAFDITTGLQIAKYLGADPVNNRNFGYSVALDGTNALAGALGANSNQGSAYRFTVGSVTAAPEPASLGLLGVGFVGMVGMIARRKAKP